MTDEQLMKLALKNSCTPYGKADPGTYAFIAGYKVKEAELQSIPKEDNEAWKERDWKKFICWYSGMTEKSVNEGIEQYKKNR